MTVSCGELKGSAARSYFWTTTEISALRRLVETDCNWTEVACALPGRSEVAVYQKACELGYTRPWVKSASVDYTMIDKTLQERVAGHKSTGVIKQIASELKVPAWQVSRRAGQLGLSRGRLKENNWTEAEIDILDAHGDTGVAAVLRKLKSCGFERSFGSISVMMKRRQIERLGHLSLSARAVAEMMGVDGKTVVRWIEAVDLKAKFDSGVWQIAQKDLKKWLLSHPTSFDLKKVRQDWFMSLMRG